MGTVSLNRWHLSEDQKEIRKPPMEVPEWSNQRTAKAKAWIGMKVCLACVSTARRPAWQRHSVQSGESGRRRGCRDYGRPVHADPGWSFKLLLKTLIFLEVTQASFPEFDLTHMLTALAPALRRDWRKQRHKPRGQLRGYCNNPEKKGECLEPQWREQRQ